MSLEIYEDGQATLIYDPTGFDLAMYVIYPPDRGPTQPERLKYQASESPNASFGSKTSAFYVHLPTRDAVKTLVHYSGESDDLALSLHLESNELTFALSHAMQRKLRAAAVGA